MNAASHPDRRERFRHEALLYAGIDDFLRATTRFIHDGVEADEPTLVVVAKPKIDSLRETLGDAAEQVVFADMAGVGANPGRIIPAWQDFVDAHAGSGRPLRGVGEPVWAERDPVTLLECQRHETLLNVAFDGGPPWWLLCPYDTLTLPPDVVAEAERSHRFVAQSTGTRPSAFFGGATSPLEAPLDAPADGAHALTFSWGSLGDVRALASREAARAGLLSGPISELVMAVNEVATNSLSHGSGSGVLRVWHRAGALVCEVTDTGRVHAPLADRRRPGADPHDPRGLWLANQLCDLVQLRSSAAGTTVRLHMQPA
jgi:anti-sigma regulatory factor (Ser/Thr protein kinase)